MNQSFKTLFFLKKGKGYTDGPLPIYVRITIDGKRAECSLQRSCEPSRWNKNTGRVAGSKNEAVQLNSYLDNVQGKIFSIQSEHALRNETLAACQVIACLLNKNEEKRHSIIEVYKHHNLQFGRLVGIEYSAGTLKKFKSAFQSLQKYIKWKFHRDDLSLAEINHVFITEYEYYLKTIQKVQHNSAMGNIKKLKKVIRMCVANEWMNNDPFKSYKITSKETHRNFLLKEELDLLVSRKFTIPRLDQVRDIFVFSCFTGLSYTDVIKLTPQDLSVGIDGELWVFTNRTKTDTPSRVPLLPAAKEILAKYSNHPKVAHSGKLLPHLSNEKLNSYLKEITAVCGFKKDLTFHCARHTFATTVTLTNGVPLETVSKMLGHKNLRTTQIYAKILDCKISDDMKLLRQKLTKGVE